MKCICLLLSNPLSNDDILTSTIFDNLNEFSRVLHLQNTFCRAQHMLLRSKERKKNAANVKINYRNIAAEKSYTQLQQGNTKAQNDQVLFHFL